MTIEPREGGGTIVTVTIPDSGAKKHPGTICPEV